MIKTNGKMIEINKFPDGTLLMKDEPSNYIHPVIYWGFESNEELIALYYITRHLQSHGFTSIDLWMPYIPNARQDRVKSSEDVFTLKYFSEMINSLHFSSVTVLDPHSSVSEALIDHLKIETPERYIWEAIKQIKQIGSNNLMLFYPDEGAMKRYSNMVKMPYSFGIKKRDWATGNIEGLEVFGDANLIAGRDVLIVDDICSRGGTFYHSAKKLKELGANRIYLYVTHCEHTILEGELLTSGLIERVYTTNSVFRKEHERIEVFEL